MKSAAHQYEDKLLEFAYGELPQHEAEAVDAHVRGCNRCSQSLSEIRGVRAAMARLPMEPAPDAGLESLLAYAEQAAKRNAAEAKPAPSFFKRFMMPLASLAALVTVGVVGFRASQEFETSPGAAMADQKVAAVEEASRQKAQTEAPDNSLEAKNEDSRNRGKDLAAAKSKGKEGRAAADELNDKLSAGKKGDEGGYQQSAGDVWGPEPKPMPKPAPPSMSKRAPKVDAEPVGNAETYRQVKTAENFSDVGLRSSKLEKDATKSPPPPPAPPPSQDKPTFGLGSSSPGSGTQSALGGASTRDSNDAPSALSQQGSSKPSPAPVAPPAKAEPPRPDPRGEQNVLAEKQQREEREKAVVAKEVVESKKRVEEDRRVQAQEEERPAPAPVAAAPSAPSSTYQPYAPSKKSKGGGFGLGVKPQMSSNASIDNDYAEMLQRSDAVGLNNDAKVAENQRRDLVTRSVESARVASSSGDRMGEIQLLMRALQNGATGYEKAEALKRICDAYEALGEPESGDAYCNQLLREFPTTVAAKVVAERRKAQVKRAAPSPKKPNAPSERKAVDFDDAAKPADAAPAQSY